MSYLAIIDIISLGNNLIISNPDAKDLWASAIARRIEKVVSVAGERAARKNKNKKAHRNHHPGVLFSPGGEKRIRQGHIRGSPR